MTERDRIEERDGAPSGLDSPHHRRRRPARAPSAIAFALIAAALVLAGGYSLDRALAGAAREQVRQHTLHRLAALRAGLEGAIARNLYLVRGLAAAVALDPELDRAAFERLAASLMRGHHEIRNIGLAPGMVIRHVYPRADNEAAEGLDLEHHPVQGPAARRARDTRAMVVDGPVELVQGGRGLVARIPVLTAGPDPHTGGERFWGLVSVVLDLDRLFRAAGLRDAAPGLAVAIRARDGHGAAGGVFYGSPSLFAADAVRLEVSLPSGSWEMAARPLAPGSTVTPTMWRVRGFTALAALLAALLGGAWARQMAARAREHALLIDAIESVHEGFALWDADDRLVLCNSRYRELYHPLLEGEGAGVSYAALLARAVREGLIETGSDPDRWYARRADGHRRAASGPVEIELATGRVLRVSERRTRDGGLVGIHTDVTAVREAERAIAHQAYHDPLTGLANRTGFLDALRTAIARARRGAERLAVLFVDLDRFKAVNDSLGHSGGDEVLRQAGARIRTRVRGSDTVARIGGDEFVILLVGFTDPLAPRTVAEAIVAALREPYEVAGTRVRCGASVGITVCPDDATDLDTLLHNADLAMYQAKQDGEENVRFFTAELTARARRHTEIDRALRAALEAGELEVHYQPVVDLRARRPVGAEALLRWRRRDGERIGPAEFIPVAEESGLIVALGEWVLERACRDAARWSAVEGRRPYVAVNVSSRQLRGGLDADRVARALAGAGLAGDRLVVEITESLLMDDDGATRHTLEAIRALGVGLALDDFGTGYSSLSYLRRFPVSAIKIDRAFVGDLATEGGGDARLVEAILAMAGGLGIAAIAEGVEVEAQVRTLAALGCTLGQGYLFARPMPGADFARWLEDGGRPWPQADARRAGGAG